VDLAIRKDAHYVLGYIGYRSRAGKCLFVHDATFVGGSFLTLWGHRSVGVFAIGGHRELFALEAIEVGGINVQAEVHLHLLGDGFYTAIDNHGVIVVWELRFRGILEQVQAVLQVLRQEDWYLAGNGGGFMDGIDDATPVLTSSTTGSSSSSIIILNSDGFVCLTVHA